MNDDDIYEWDEETQTYMWASNSLIEEQEAREAEDEYLRELGEFSF